MRGLIVVVALAAVLAAAPVYAQAGDPAKPAAPTPAAPAPQAPAAQPPAPKPFPQGSKVAYIVLERVARESADGRASFTRLGALQQKRSAEMAEKQKQLVGLQQKLEKEGAVMSPNAGADLQKQIEKMNLEVQRFAQDAEAELQEMQQSIQADFQQKAGPIIQQVAQDLGVHFIFNAPEAGIVWADPSVDITTEVIKRLDAAKPAAKPAAPTKPPGQ